MGYVIILRSPDIIEKYPIENMSIERIGKLIGGEVESADTIFDGVMLLYDFDGAVSDKPMNMTAMKATTGNSCIFGDAILAACDGREFFAFDSDAADILMKELE